MLVHALQYIRDHADQSLTVGGIAEAVSTSRRTLERKFSHELKRSVLSEIKRVRAEQVTVLLVQTSWSISRIAQHLHFPTCSHMARFFRQEKGCTPGDYRRQCQKGTKGVRSNSVRPGICDEE